MQAPTAAVSSGERAMGLSCLEDTVLILPDNLSASSFKMVLEL